MYFTCKHFPSLNLITPFDDFVLTVLKDGVFRICKFAVKFAVAPIVEKYKYWDLSTCELKRIILKAIWQ
jgi:hypothetical protein